MNIIVIKNSDEFKQLTAAPLDSMIFVDDKVFVKTAENEFVAVESMNGNGEMSNEVNVVLSGNPASTLTEEDFLAEPVDTDYGVTAAEIFLERFQGAMNRAKFADALNSGELDKANDKEDTHEQ